MPHTPSREPRMRRRLFLGSAAVLTAAGAIEAQTEVRKKIRSLLVEGVIPPEEVVARQPLVLPPDLLAALQAGFQVRLRVEYPHRANLLVFYAFLAAPTDPAPPLAQLSPADPRIFVHIEFEIDDVLVASSPRPSFGLYGRAVAEPKPSPFFPGVTGLVSSVEGGFVSQGNTAFALVGVSCAGDHAVFAPVAQGFIDVQG